MAVTLFVALLTCLTIFQFALAAGAPLGEYAWGGQRTGVLPKSHRVGSAVSILIYAFFAVVALDRTGVLSIFPDWFSRPAAWVVFSVLALGTLMNLISRSRKERFVMTPVAAALALLAYFIAVA